MAKTMKATIELGGRVDKSLLASMSAAEKQMALLNRSAGAIHKVAGAAVKTAAMAATAAGAAIVKVAKDSIEAGRNFDSSMSQVAATMGKSIDEIGDLRRFALDMGKTTMFSASQSADALNYMALAGYDAATSMKMLPNVLNLAAAGSMELAQASDMVTDASSALSLSLDETALLVDEMAMAASKSNTTVAQLGEAILTVGGTAKDMKGGTVELAQALGILADNGIKGAEGGTALRNVLLGLSSSKFNETFGKLGVSAYDAQGNMRALEDVFLDLNKAMSDMTVEEKTAALSKAFNKVDLKSLNALLGTSKDRWEELSEAIGDSAGAAEKMAKTQMDNLSGDITYFQSALEGAQIAISDALTPALREFVQFATEGIGEITDLLESDGFKDFAAAVARDVTGAVRDAISALDEMKSGFAEGFDTEGFAAALDGVARAVGGAFGDGGNMSAARGFGGMLAGSLNVAADAIRAVTPAIAGIAGAFRFFADNAETILPIIGRLVGVFVTLSAVSSIVGKVSAIGTALGIVGSAGTAAGAGLAATGSGAAKAGAAAARSAGQLLAMGGAVLMIGGGVALAALGLGLMAQSAIALSEAGAPAIAIMLGMVASLFALGAGAYFAGPAFTIAAPGILAFGAAVFMVGAGIGIASAGLSMLAGQLPAIAGSGMAASAALAAMGAGLLVMGAGALVAGAGLLVCAPGLLAFTVAAVPAAGAVTLLSGAVGLLSVGIGASADSIGTMGWGMQAMADNAGAAVAGLNSLATTGLLVSSAFIGVQGASQTMAVAILALPGAALAGAAGFKSFARAVSGSMREAQSAVWSACVAMQASVSSMRLTIPAIRVAALPHFTMTGEFDPKTKSVPTIAVSYYASGGFTSGPVAIAGEAGTEAVISFERRYRDENIAYWLMAGQMLGVIQPMSEAGFPDGRASDLSIEIASDSGALAMAAGRADSRGAFGDTVNFGGITFAPQITVSGTGKQDVLAQLRRAEDEFRDMLDEWASEREGDYAPVF